MTSNADDFDDDWTEAQDQAWLAEQRTRVLEYLDGEGVPHGVLAERPAWHVGPLVAIWAVGHEDLAERPACWAISGDLPCDYCQAEEGDEPRDGLRRIAQAWRDAIEATPSDAAAIHDSSLPAHLAPLLASRAELLLEWVEDESLWATLH